MEFALIRHTRCDIDAGVCYGQLDVRLAASAREDIAQTLARVPPVDVVFSSPSQRCHALAQSLAQRDGCEVQVRADLRELNFGDWEGQRWSDIPRARSDAWTSDTWRLAPPNGESESQLWDRAARVAAELLQLPSAIRVAVVSHGGPLRQLRCLLTGAPEGERWAWNCALGEVLLIPRTGTTIKAPRE